MVIEKKLFISYSWNNYNEVEKIDKDFESIGIVLTRDIRDVGDYKSIKTFMKKIKTTDYALMIISDSYLKSKNCMYEVLELLKEDDYKDKILPILLDDCNNISTIEGKTLYIKFWEDEYKKNKELIESVNFQNSVELINDLNIIENISRNISHFLSVITDMKHSSLSKLKEENYKPILDYIGFDENSIEAKLLKIRLINNVEEQDLAIKNLQEKYSNNPKFFFFRGKFEYEHRKNYIKAITYYTKAIKLNSNDYMAYNNRGVAKSSLGQREEAILDFTEVIKLNSDDFMGYYNRGHAKADLSLHEEAILDFTDAIRLNPDDFRVYENRGSSQLALGRYEEAILDFTDTINLKPDNYTAYHNRGAAKDELRKYEEAILDYTEAIKIDPDFYVAYHNRGVAKAKLGQQKEAILDYIEAINLNPDFLMSYVKRGELNFILGRYEEAIFDYTEAIRLNQDDFWFYNNRGRINFILKRYEEAIPDFMEVINLNPNAFWAYYDLGILKSRLGKIEEAILDLKQAANGFLNQNQFKQHQDCLKLIDDLNGKL